MPQKKQRRGRRPKPAAKREQHNLDSVMQLWEDGKEDEALRQAMRLRERQPKDSLLVSMIAGMLVSQERADEAIELIEEVMQDSPDPLLYPPLAAAYLMESRPAAARRTALLARELGPVPEIAEEMERLLQDIPTYEELIGSPVQLLPSLAEEVAQLQEDALLAADQEDFEEAEALMEEAAALVPHLGSVQAWHAWTVFAAGRHEEAIAELRQILTKLDKSNVRAASHLVTVLATLGRWDEARAAGAGLVQMATTPAATFAVVEALGHLNEHQAIYNLLKGLQDAPPTEDETGELDDLSLLRLAFAAANLGRKDEAARLLQDLEDVDVFLAALQSDLYEGVYRGRFPYNPPSEMLPPGYIDTFLMDLIEEGGSSVDRAKVTSFAAGCPSILDALEQWLYWGEPEQTSLALLGLGAIDTEEAKQRLDRFTASGAPTHGVNEALEALAGDSEDEE